MRMLLFVLPVAICGLSHFALATDASTCHRVESDGLRECRDQEYRDDNCITAVERRVSECWQQVNRESGGPVRPDEACNARGVIPGHYYKLRNGGAIYCP